MADAMTTAHRSQSRSTAGGSAASNVLILEDDGWAVRCRLAAAAAGWKDRRF
jgi:hypothetical protein